MNEEIEPRKTNYTPWIILAFVAVIALALMLVFRPSTKVEKPYSAVFLTNNQVYFGYLTVGPEFSTITDVHYIQAVPQASSTETSLVVIKLGQEPHAPKNQIELNNDHILYYEDISDDGPVVQRIKELKSK